jgi:hypothetical protein
MRRWIGTRNNRELGAMLEVLDELIMKDRVLDVLRRKDWCFWVLRGKVWRMVMVMVVRNGKRGLLGARGRFGRVALQVSSLH